MRGRCNNMLNPRMQILIAGGIARWANLPCRTRTRQTCPAEPARGRLALPNPRAGQTCPAEPARGRLALPNPRAADLPCRTRTRQTCPAEPARGKLAPAAVMNHTTIAHTCPSRPSSFSRR